MSDTFPPSRLESFSDGVIAVIITIMVLEIKVPSEKGLPGFIAIAPSVGVYALSFTFVGIYWVNHHLLLHRLRKASPNILWANLVWLFALSLLPFFTAYVYQHNDDGFSVAIYAAELFITGLSFMLLRITISARQHAEGSLEPIDRALQIKHWGSLAVYFISIPLATFYPLISLGLIAAITLLWVIPSLGVERSDELCHSHPPVSSPPPADTQSE
jgi:uncharacterized membrane protein